MKQTKQTPWRWPLPRLPLLAAFLILTPASAHAHLCVDVSGQSCPPSALSHNTVEHLANTAYSNCVSTFGRAACDAARDTAEAVGSTARDVANQGAEAGRTVFETGQQMLEGGMQTGQQMVDTVGRTARQGIDCALDLAGCAAQVAEDAGLSPEQTQQLTEFAVLRGTITMDTTLPGQAALLKVHPVNWDGVSPACEALLAAMSIAPGQLATTVPVTAGAYTVVVPACGRITYALVPANPLYTWTPPRRDVTVEPGGNPVSTIGVPTLNQTGTTAGGEAATLQRGR